MEIVCYCLRPRHLNMCVTVFMETGQWIQVKLTGTTIISSYNLQCSIHTNTQSKRDCRRAKCVCTGCSSFEGQFSIITKNSPLCQFHLERHDHRPLQHGPMRYNIQIWFTVGHSKLQYTFYTSCRHKCFQHLNVQYLRYLTLLPGLPLIPGEPGNPRGPFMTNEESKTNRKRC